MLGSYQKFGCSTYKGPFSRQIFFTRDYTRNAPRELHPVYDRSGARSRKGAQIFFVTNQMQVTRGALYFYGIPRETGRHSRQGIFRFCREPCHYN